MIGDRDPSLVLGGAPQVSAGARWVALAGIVEVWRKVGQTARGFCARHRSTPKYSRLCKAPYATLGSQQIITRLQSVFVLASVAAEVRYERNPEDRCDPGR